MDNTNIVPEIDFNISDNNFSINDIMNQTNGVDNSNKEVNNVNKTGKFNITDVDEFIDDNDDNDLNEVVNSQLINQQEKAVDNKEHNQPEVKEYNEDLYSLLFDFVKEQGILHIPDDIEMLDEEKLKWVIEENDRIKYENALEHVRQQAGDDKVVELFDFVYNGGTWEDINNMRELLTIETEYEKLDEKNEQDQRFLIESFLKEGLDVRNPAHKRRLDKINEEVESYIERLEGEDVAKEAKAYFVNKINEEKERLSIEKEERLKQEQQYKIKAQQEEAKWIDDFKVSLNKRTWSNDKKQNVIKQFDMVSLDNGQEMELWRYKWGQMWKKPELVHVFMDFLSNLDPFTMEFKGDVHQSDKAATKKLIEMANKKQTSKQVSSRTETMRQQQSNNQPTLNARDYM